MTKIVGLTGGIGSGKSTIAQFFNSLGVPVYIADAEAKNLMDNADIKDAITKKFGNAILQNNELNRKKIAEIVFSDKGKLAELNAIVHPAVAHHFKAWVAKHADAEIVVKEAAILFESGSYKDCDAIVMVTAPEPIRIERVMKRDGITEEMVRIRINNQWDEAKKMELSDFIIENINLDSAKEQVSKVLKELRNS
ncbi:dephospho-CoA kinase [Flavobacterium kingsejongi]|uniref:Dephospho-CoA kinase n=1 Tax=Flavobacterium kingsejongi TaxID=1678728 RepID=A0A2S1LS51_9FLAO|nr:dephospho-CoA kinase [Flavobacterium kingsejongi]AWG26593.1 dephospho-CoA kinase [Flavobacterium kingsejongi]